MRAIARVGVLVGLGTAATAHAQAPVEAGHASTLRQRLSGTFRPSPGPENETQRDGGIETAVRALFFVARPIARSRLLAGNPLFPTVRIRVAESEAEVQTPPVHAIAPCDGTERRVVGLDHQENHLVHALTPAGLVQTTWTEAGTRTTHFLPSDDGQHLTLQVEVKSPRLPVPVRYRLQYVRDTLARP